ncbi:MAG: zinc ribbon domain-containing protein [Ruminococcus sp.]|nr:zinc ribbon domain-containing protein [Ruminococcus sp.]
MKKVNKTPIGIRIAIIVGKVLSILTILLTALVACSDQITISEAKDAGGFIYYEGDYYDTDEIIEVFTSARNQALIVLFVFAVVLVGLFILGSMLKKKYGVAVLVEQNETVTEQPVTTAKESVCPKCGEKVKVGEPFCGHCGAKME